MSKVNILKRGLMILFIVLSLFGLLTFVYAGEIDDGPGEDYEYSDDYVDPTEGDDYSGLNPSKDDNDSENEEEEDRSSSIDEEQVGTIEEIVTYLLDSLGDILLEGIRGIMGSNLSVDSLIFNTYNDTKIDIYNSGATGISATVRSVINYWYGVFSYITYIGYVVILVYTGVRIILHSGTEKQEQMKKYLGNWVMGLLILFTLPTLGVPLIINLNNALVDYIGRNIQENKNYYNKYESSGDILGSDSSTIAFEDLLGLREETQGKLDDTKGKIDKNLKPYINQITDDFYSQYLTSYTNAGDWSREDIQARAKSATDSALDYFVTMYPIWQERGLTEDEMKEEFCGTYRATWSGNDWLRGDENRVMRNRIDKAAIDCFFRTETDSNGFIKIIDVNPSFWSTLQDCAELNTELEDIDRQINEAKKDFMGLMRIYAGRYHRIIYAILWWVLLFQLIGLTFLYFKRVFVVAILITVFPIIMLFYCIDKMGDGAAQTLRLWIKELLANIFVQSVHAVIYAVLVNLGMQIYASDMTNWVFFVAAMLFILPAESIMKEIFDLNGSTLRQVGGMFGKALSMITIGKSVANIAKAGLNNDALEERRQKRFDKMQHKQDRADMKSQRRQAKELIKNPGNLNSDGSVNLTGARAIREGAYHLATNARQLKNNITESGAFKAAETVVEGAKKVGAVGAGVAYGLAGGDLDSMRTGLQVASSLMPGSSSSSSSDSKKKDVKRELKSAYSRKKK